MDQGKVVMVTGASSGMGRELCLYLATAGCRIVAAARRTDRLRMLCDEINGAFRRSSSEAPRLGVRAVAIDLDVTADGAAIGVSVGKAWDAFGRIDVLVNNAGMRGGIHSPLDWTEEEWDKIVNTNLTGVWLLSKNVCKLMKDAKVKGSVVNISSITGLERGQLPGALAYSATKTGVNAITRVMALEMGVYKIRVNSIAPGIFKSEITEGLMNKEWLKNVVAKTVPLRTFGTSDPAMTALVSYLIDDASQYVTGNVFIVDAGATLPGVPIFSSL